MYRQEYHSKLTTAEQAVALIPNSATVVHGMATGEPPALLVAIAARARQGDLRDIKIFIPPAHGARRPDHPGPGPR